MAGQEEVPPHINRTCLLYWHVYRKPPCLQIIADIIADAARAENTADTRPSAPPLGEDEDSSCAIHFGPIERRVAFVPCGHATYCADCVAILREREGDGARCPTCRAIIEGQIPVHM